MSGCPGSQTNFLEPLLLHLESAVDTIAELKFLSQSIKDVDKNDTAAIKNILKKLNVGLEVANYKITKTKTSVNECLKRRCQIKDSMPNVNSCTIVSNELNGQDTENDVNGDNVEPEGSEENISKEELFTEKPKIGSINVVDIKKLLDPSVSQANQQNTVIILSDSEAESDMHTNITNTNQSIRKKKNSKPVESSLQGTSTSFTRMETILKAKKTNDTKNENLSPKNEIETILSNLENPKDGNVMKMSPLPVLRGLSIRLPRVPCEKLKEYYLEKDTDRKKRLLNNKEDQKRKRHKPVEPLPKSVEPVVAKSALESPIVAPDANKESTCVASLPLSVSADYTTKEVNVAFEETPTSETSRSCEEMGNLKEVLNECEDEEKYENNHHKSKSKRIRAGVRFGSFSESEDESDIKLLSGSEQNNSNKQRKPTGANSDVSDIEPQKQKNRNRKVILNSDSDTDSEQLRTVINKHSSSDDSCEKSKPREFEKRKRIRRIQDSSSEDEKENKKRQSTRRHIRKVLKDHSLNERTKIAEKEERDRKARIVEKQKKYNQFYGVDLSSKAVVEKVVLDYNEKTQTELLKVDSELVKVLKPHQASGIQFMWDACFESVNRAKKSVGSGCILAHCMGLGKTLQVVALSHTLLIHGELTGVKRILILCPLSTVLNWVAEFKQWIPESTADEIEVYDLVSTLKVNSVREHVTSEWYRNGGVLVMGYDMFRNLSNPENKRITKKMRTKFQTALADPGPDLVVCDEGHLLKNEKTSISLAVNRLKTLRRIVLTGTPLQNNLKEYFCMVQFVKPNLLGTYKEYLNRFVNPITNGQYTDSTPFDIQLMRKRSHVLHKLLDGVVQRRDYSVLEPYLPPKHEFVVFVNLSSTQLKLYRYYLENFARKPMDENGKVRPTSLFADFQELLRICTHPRVLLDKSIQAKNAKEKLFDDEEDSEGSLKDFIDDEDDVDSNESTSDTDKSENSSLSDKHSKTKERFRVTRSNAVLAGGLEEIDKHNEKRADPEWWEQFCPNNVLEDITTSGKLVLLFEILKECETIGDKLLIFSQSLYSLNAIEYFLRKVDEATQNGDTETVSGYTGSWALGLDYFRLDGSSSCDNRSAWCKTFNDPDNIRARLFLISTRAGGLGINLYAANRVIIFDVSWNPSHDIQSIYRIYRFGQKKPCYIYRFVTHGTMEMKIYDRQVIKQAISKRVIDEQQIDRHYTQSDLAELYKFDPQIENNKQTPLVPKDVLLAELLQKFGDRIYKYHEHQSLLENKEDEVLNEEERKAAWEEYENEKNMRVEFQPVQKAIFHGIPVDTVALALTNLLKRENPAWSNQRIKQLLPSLLVQINQQMQNNDTTMYGRIVQEIKDLQALQAQKMQMYYLQQQQEFMQQQQFRNLVDNSVPTNPERLMPQYRTIQPRPGTSVQYNNSLNTNDIIDLND